MNKRVIAILIAAVICSAGVATANNVLVNPSFETGTLGPWFANAGAPVVTNAQAHTGSFSVASFGDSSIQQNLAAIPTSNIVELSLWVKREGGPFNEYHLYYDDATSDSFVISGFPDGNDWNFYNLTSHLAPGKNLNGFSIYGTSSGPAYLDDFTIAVPVPEPCAATLLAFCCFAFRWRVRLKTH